MSTAFIDTIKSRGYWRINFQPATYETRFLSLTDAKDAVERASLSFRGWDYPHFPHRNDESSAVETGESFVQGRVNWGAHKELWRAYLSGQFIHYLALREDWMEGDGWYGELSKKITPMNFLGVTGSVVYQITEIFVFASRLCERGIYKDGLTIDLTLMNCENRALWVDDPRRLPFSFERKTVAKKIGFVKQYQAAELVQDPSKLALVPITKLFDAFGWANPPMETIGVDQQNLLSKRL